MSEPPAKTALFGSKDTIFISNMQPQKTYFTTYLHAILAILLQYAHVATKRHPGSASGVSCNLCILCFHYTAYLLVRCCKTT